VFLTQGAAIVLVDQVLVLNHDVGRDSVCLILLVDLTPKLFLDIPNPILQAEFSEVGFNLLLPKPLLVAGRDIHLRELVGEQLSSVPLTDNQGTQLTTGVPLHDEVIKAVENKVTVIVLLHNHITEDYKVKGKGIQDLTEVAGIKRLADIPLRIVDHQLELDHLTLVGILGRLDLTQVESVEWLPIQGIDIGGDTRSKGYGTTRAHR